MLQIDVRSLTCCTTSASKQRSRTAPNLKQAQTLATFLLEHGVQMQSFASSAQDNAKSVFHPCDPLLQSRLGLSIMLMALLAMLLVNSTLVICSRMLCQCSACLLQHLPVSAAMMWLSHMMPSYIFNFYNALDLNAMSDCLS